MPKQMTATVKPSAKPVGIWIRVSTDDQARGDSPEHHEKRARAYAEASGWRVKTVYQLAGVSGKSVREHPEAQRMLADVERGRITGLIFSKLARLARNTKELLEFSDYFRKHEADLISLEEKIDTSSPAGRLFYTLIAAMAQWEREEIASRVAASVPIRAKLGKPTGGMGPLGYHWVEKRLVPHPKGAETVRLIFDLFLEHRRLKTVARILSERGYRSRRGAKFTDSVLRRVLEDTVYKGLHRANYTRSKGDKKSWVLKPREEWVYTKVEPIVPEDVWDRVNAVLFTHRLGPRPTARRAVHLFSGLVVCHCGPRMYVPSNSPKYICHKCRNKIPVEDMEVIFRTHLQQFLLSPKDLEKGFRGADKALTAKEGEIQGLQHERERVTAGMDKAFHLYCDGHVTGDGFAKRNQPLEERLREIDATLPVLQGEVEAMRMQRVSRNEALAEARDFSKRWDKLSREEKRQIIEIIVETITIGKEDVHIVLRHLPGTLRENVAKRQRDFTG